MINIIKKYCYFSIPLIFSIIFLTLNFFGKLTNIKLNPENINTLIGIIGSLIGFLLTSITIFLSLPRNSTLMINIKKYKHHIIFLKCIAFGITSSILTLILWIFQINYYYILMFFMISIIETCISAYYIYLMCLYSFE